MRAALFLVLPAVAAVTLCTLPIPAIAAPNRGAPTDARALELFEQSEKAYRDGKFQEAVDRLLEARRYKAEPVLLYDLGRAYEALGKPSDAADAYAKYLQEEPDAGDRKAIEGRIATLRAQANDLAAAAAKDREREDDPFAVVPWVVAGLGVAAVGTGLVLGAVAKGKHDDAKNEPVQTKAVDEQDSAESLSRAANVTLIAGAVVAAMGIAWLGIRAATPRATSRGFVLGVTF